MPITGRDSLPQVNRQAGRPIVAVGNTRLNAQFEQFWNGQQVQDEYSPARIAAPKCQQK